MLRSDGESVDVNWDRDDQFGRSSASRRSSRSSDASRGAAGTTGAGRTETGSAGRRAPVSDASFYALPFGATILKPDFHLMKERKLNVQDARLFLYVEFHHSKTAVRVFVFIFYSTLWIKTMKGK